MPRRPLEGSGEAAALEDAPGEERLDHDNFYVSITCKKRFRRLHQLGWCWRRPGHGVLDWQPISAQDVEDRKFDAPCKDCCGKSLPVMRS